MMDHNYWQQSNSSVAAVGNGVGNGGNYFEENQPLPLPKMDSPPIPENLIKAEISPSTSNNESLQFVLDDGTAIVIQIHNMLCNYTLPMHIDLRMVAYRSINVDHDRFRGVLVKQLRNPPCLVKIFNSGKIVIVKCKSEHDCKRAARSIGRMVQRSMNKLDQKIRIQNFRVSNILATCRMPFGIRIEDLARKYRAEGAKYEPELMIGLEWAFDEPKANLRIHTTGSITITGATSEAGLIESIKKVYPFLKEFACQRGEKTTTSSKARRRPRMENSNRNGHRPMKKSRRGQVEGTGMFNGIMNFSDEDEEYNEEDEEEEIDEEEEFDE